MLSERQKNEEGKVDTEAEAEDKIKGEDDGDQEVEDESVKAEGGAERDEGESGEDDLAGNESSHTKRISLLGFVLMALIPLIL